MYKETAADRTTWGSVNAEDMFQIATRMAGFDPMELMKEIHRRTMHSKALKVNEHSVLEAMQTVFERYETPAWEKQKGPWHPERYRKDAPTKTHHASAAQVLAQSDDTHRNFDDELDAREPGGDA